MKKISVVAVCLFFICLFPVKKVSAQVWGDVNLGLYPLQSHIMAPNGLVYKPLAHLGINLNVGIENFYIFDENVLLLERQNPGVTTNQNQAFDFTKRELDFKIGIAARPLPWKELEFRFWAISLNNLNRGNDSNRPTGFKDGVAVEGRYYFGGERIWGYLMTGYYFSKVLIAPDGEPYKPGVFGGGDFNFGLIPSRLYLFADATVINLFGDLDGGVAYRPFRSCPNTELRLEAGRYFDLNEKSLSQTKLLFEIKYYFKSM